MDWGGLDKMKEGRMQTVTQVRNGISLAQRAALTFAEIARPFSVVVAIFSAAVLLAVTTSSYAGPCDIEDRCTEDTIVVGNNGAILGGSVSTFKAGAHRNPTPWYQIV